MSKEILIIGATGPIGSKLRTTLLEKTDYKLSLFLTRSTRLQIDRKREETFTGNINDKRMLERVFPRQDAVFVDLSEDEIETMTEDIVEIMDKTPEKRLIFVLPMGIYNEIPTSIGGGNLRENPRLKPYRKAADVIEASHLNYTIIRPGRFDEGNDDIYEITKKREPVMGYDVSKKAICNFVLILIQQKGYGGRENFGIYRPQK